MRCKNTLFLSVSNCVYLHLFAGRLIFNSLSFNIDSDHIWGTKVNWSDTLDFASLNDSSDLFTGFSSESDYKRANALFRDMRWLEQGFSRWFLVQVLKKSTTLWLNLVKAKINSAIGLTQKQDIMTVKIFFAFGAYRKSSTEVCFLFVCLSLKLKTF